MSVTAISRDWADNVSIVRLVSTNSKATCTGANYITAQADNISTVNKGAFEWLDNDCVLLTASDGNLLCVIDAAFTTLTALSSGGTAGSKAASNNSLATVSSVSGTTVLGHLAKFADTAGTVTDQGVQMKSVFGAATSGAGATVTITDAFCTATSCVIANWNLTTNAGTYIYTVTAGSGTFAVVSNQAPGASELNYVIFK